MRYLFAGPTLPDAREVLDKSDVRVLPPIAHGDLLRLPLQEGDVVGIVDGVFHHVAAVRHKEILAALSAGVRVLGASSMGALRAAELDRYGMEGVGNVYSEYATGRVLGDDEVALLHGPAEAAYPSFSEPLVNLRATLMAAGRDGVLTEDERVRLLERLAVMPYVSRTQRVLVETAEEIGLDPAGVRALRDYCRDHMVDVKRSDALLLIDQMMAPSDRPAVRPALSRTTFLQQWELIAGGGPEGEGGHWVSDVSRIRVCQLLAHDYVEFHRRLVLGLVTRECERECQVYRPGRPEVRTAVEHGWHRGFYADHVDGADFGFLARWTSETERSERTPEELLATFIARASRRGEAPTDSAIERLKGTPAFARAGRIATAAAQIEAKLKAANRDVSQLAADRITDWLAERWAAEPEDMDFAAMDRGLDSLDVAVAAARPFYLLAKYDPEKVDFTVLAENASERECSR